MEITEMMHDEVEAVSGGGWAVRLATDYIAGKLIDAASAAVASLVASGGPADYGNTNAMGDSW